MEPSKRNRDVRIFISYRRADSEGYAGRIFDYLVERFDKGNVFLDVETIKAGDDFTRDIGDAIGSCHALIALIGPHWLAAADEKGRRRIDQPGDYVRLEIAAALKRNILVIPVLVQGAEMPRPEDLPGELKALHKRSAVEISFDRFVYDMDRLVEAVGGAYGTVIVTGPVDPVKNILSRGRNSYKHKSQFTVKPPRDMYPTRVYVDGVAKARLEHEDTAVIKLKEGVHTVYLSKLNLGFSNHVTFRLKGGQTVKLTASKKYPTNPYEKAGLVLQKQEIY